MKTTITAKKMQIPQNFSEHAVSRIDSRLGKFFGEEAEAKIVIKEFKNQIELELTVKYNSMIYRAERSAEDKMVALDDAIDKIIRQIRKNKTRIEKKLKDTAFKESFAEPVSDVSDYEVIKHKKFKMRPMHVEEAILQMNMLGHKFFMFSNAETGETNVVYKREDGNYAVLEPDND
ncbi:MAG: ribosome-associated translation inhibitor RaiA [Ruminococcus flavefaciens]|nr:ribosome-associated translation inhibitor RaiA [Ruminococcus flavefaciens]MCM1060495.1 ribosome-associated translation inhibitor RaiA [Eubacterium sp.]MCM1271728.1 ribosome-associated translation inhibitor RaiA [Ruminococcus flavefaciens]MCM1360969.1 ribosome-associated translation inhibitor RaiA [Clostridiales bacterium]